MLAQRGVHTYLPWLPKQKRRLGRRDSEPLFPGYLFAHLRVPSDEWIAARSAPDVVYFLGYGGQPTPVTEEFVSALQSRLEKLGHEGGFPRFTHGERVIIDRETFQYVEAIFDRFMTATGRVRMLVQFLNRHVAIDLPEDAVKKTR
jgi:transcriptional antiterminator RfaH